MKAFLVLLRIVGYFVVFANFFFQACYVDKYFLSVFAFNKSEAFGIVKKFYCSCVHVVVFVLTCLASGYGLWYWYSVVREESAGFCIRPFLAQYIVTIKMASTRFKIIQSSLALKKEVCLRYRREKCKNDRIVSEVLQTRLRYNLHKKLLKCTHCFRIT